MRLTKLFPPLLIGLFVLSLAAPAISEEDVIKERQELEKSNNKISRSLKKAVKAKDYAAIEAGAKKIIANAERMPSLYPEGSLSKESKATKAIWDDFGAFKQHAGWMRKGAEGLAQAAAAKDAEMVKLEYDSVTSACSQCHRDYRKRSRRKGKRKK